MTLAERKEKAYSEEVRLLIAVAQAAFDDLRKEQEEKRTNDKK